MGKVKIFVDPDETVESVEDALFKAMEHHASGDAHDDDFPDPAMVALKNKLMRMHSETYHLIIQDILKALDEDFTNGNV